MPASQRSLSPGRWHFHHGPIDLILGIDGEALTVQRAWQGAWNRFQNILQELVDELSTLRRPVQDIASVQGSTARRMVQACKPFAPVFITPMAAVAGAVAEEIMQQIAIAGVSRAYVNNGGDIALHLSAGTSYRVGLCAVDDAKPWKTSAVEGSFEVRHTSPVRGIATSGWRGRSFSMGIADSVTVLAPRASEADAAATLIANAVNVDSAAVRRCPANSLKDDTDLGDRLVTVEVGALRTEEVEQALASGLAVAKHMQSQGWIHAAVLMLDGQVRSVGEVHPQELSHYALRD